jgi:DNA gyrase inhibitor GyrI
MIRKKMVHTAVATAVVAFGFTGWKMTSRSAYESAPYTVLKSDGAIALREYPDLMLATTRMQSRSQDDDGSFMRLFNYISGGNEDNQKVAMTTPVFMEPESSEVQGQMGFVIPKKVAEQNAPEPANKDVQLQKRTGGRFAVIRFSGRINPDLIEQETKKLQVWIIEQGLTADGDVEVAGYDAPWTPGPFRRNEVLVRLKPAS